MKHTRLVLPLLLLLLAAAPGLAQDGDSAIFYLTRANQAYQQKDYAGSARDYAASLKFNPRYAVAAYNAACNYSLLNDRKQALEWLGKAVDWGFYDFEQDTDLENIRRTGQYQKLLARAQKFSAELESKISVPVISLPRDYDSTRSYGLLVALHGVGSEPNNIVQALDGVPQRMGYVLAAPYGVKPTGNGGFSWDNWDQAESKVLETVKQAREKYKIDPSRIILLGFSQGAIHAYYIGTKNSSLFRGIIPMAGTYYSEVDQFLPRSRESGLKIFIMFGGAEKEPMIKSNLDAFRSFIMSGITASLTVYAGLGHAFPPNKEFEIQRAIEWVERK